MINAIKELTAGIIASTDGVQEPNASMIVEMCQAIDAVIDFSVEAGVPLGAPAVTTQVKYDENGDPYVDAVPGFKEPIIKKREE